MTRIDIINHFIKKYNYKSYLELGVQNGISFKAINLPIENKVGVDPDPNSIATVYLTSDEFFEQNKKTFDIIFVDGLHEADAVYSDIMNALLVLNEGGVIICHDMNPLSYEAQLVPRIQKVWNGDCWRAWVKLRREGNGLEMNVVDTDHGCGIIRTQDPNILKTALGSELELTYENLEKNRKEWLNLISVEEFKELH